MEGEIVMRTSVSMLLTGLILSGFFSFVSSAEMVYPYEDIDDVSWAHEAIISYYNSGVVLGGNKKFYPYSTVKRGDAVALVIRWIRMFDEQYHESFSTVNGFNDVPHNSYYADAIGTAENAGFIFGDGENNFYPKNIMTRQDYAVILYRITQRYLAEIKTNEIIIFKDTDISDYARDAITKLHGCGVINGYEDGYFRPKQELTRVELVKMTYELLKYLDLLVD